ncbi:hypothetical protein ACQJBY_065199 [Aegilops geniculata]
MLHVCVVLEKLPMQLWTLEGAAEALGDQVIIDRLDSRTFERADTKTFAVWVWVWELHHIPTRRTLWKHARGAGRVEEMHGFSPPSRAVAPPPALLRWDILVHLDRIEDWAPLSPWSSHSGQSGLPSSDDDDGRSFPRRPPTGGWTHGAVDGRPALDPAAGTVRAPLAPTAGVGRVRPQAPVASTGCRGMPSAGARRGHDGEDGEGHRRSWKDTLLGRGRGKEPAASAVDPPERQRSRTPCSRHRQGAPRGRRSSSDHPGKYHGNGNGTGIAKSHASQRGKGAGGSKRPERGQSSRPAPPPANLLLAPPRPLPPSALVAAETDPVAEFFEEAGKELPSPPRPDPRAAAVEAAAAKKVDRPLSFTEHEADTDGDTGGINMGSTLSLVRHTPAMADTHSLELGAVTSKVCHL